MTPTTIYNTISPASTMFGLWHYEVNGGYFVIVRYESDHKTVAELSEVILGRATADELMSLCRATGAIPKHYRQQTNIEAEAPREAPDLSNLPNWGRFA